MGFQETFKISEIQNEMSRLKNKHHKNLKTEDLRKIAQIYMEKNVVFCLNFITERRLQ